MVIVNFSLNSSIQWKSTVKIKPGLIEVSNNLTSIKVKKFKPMDFGTPHIVQSNKKN